MEPEDDTDAYPPAGHEGALTYEKKGRVFVYTPAVEESEYLKVKSSSFVEH